MSAQTAASGDDWDQHWRAYAGSNAENPAQAYRRMLVFRSLGLGQVERARVLEIGSGQGELSSEIVQRYPEAKVLGLELSHTGVELAQRKVPNAVFLRRDLTEPLELPENYRKWATHAVCSEVLEHLDDPLGALRRVRECLAPGARVVITVPGGPMSAFDRHIGHRAHFTAERLHALLDDAGLQVRGLSGAGFPFFNLYRLLVIARGEKLIEDAGGELPLSAKVASWGFFRLFRLNRVESSRGWQLVAVASEPTV